MGFEDIPINGKIVQIFAGAIGIAWTAKFLMEANQDVFFVLVVSFFAILILMDDEE